MVSYVCVFIYSKGKWMQNTMMDSSVMPMKTGRVWLTVFDQILWAYNCVLLRVIIVKLEENQSQ